MTRSTNQLEKKSSDLTKEPLFKDSLVLFLESTDQLNYRPSEQIDKLNKPLLLKSILLLIIHMKYHLRRKKTL